MDSSSADERIRPIGLLSITSTDDEGHVYGLLDADRADIGQRDGLALGRTPELVREIGKGRAIYTIKATAVQREPVGRRAVDERVGGREEVVGTRKEREGHDICSDKNPEKKWMLQRACISDDRRFQSDGQRVPADVVCSVQPRRQGCKTSQARASSIQRG